MPAEVLGIVALSLTCFHGCVKGLVVLGKARSYNRDVSDVQFQTTLILHSLTTWAQEAGLMQEPPTLLVNANNAPLVPGILGQLETLFTDMNELRLRYGIYLQPTDEDVDAVDDDAASLLNVGAQRRKWTVRIDVAVFLKRKQPWKRLRWVTLDDEKFDRLLDKAKGYVSELGRFLEQARQERMEHYLEFCLRNEILNAKDEHRLGIIGKEYQKPDSNLAISAAAKLKQTRLRLGILDSTRDASTDTLSKSSSVIPIASKHDSMISSTLNSPLKDMKLSMRLLTLERAARAESLRTLARYDGRIVLLEWKYVTGMNNPTISTRVNQVAAFLQDLGPTLHSLQCRGFVRDHVANRYGYIFDLSDELNSPPRRSQLFNQNPGVPHPTPQLRPLRQMLTQSSLPSLNMRLSLAVTLLETLLNLHTAGWLHKEFRSDNILLIRRADNLGEATKNDLSAYSVYIAGYVYSRVDSPGEMTEPLKSELEADLYRHPSLLCDVRQPYRKSFDIFSVGCTLLEIGLWTTLRQILEHHSIIRPEPELPPMAERAMSDPTLAHSNPFQEAEDDRDPANRTKRPLDLMELKHELLCSHFPNQRPRRGNMANQKSPLTGASRSEIMSSLEAAMGKRYTTIVEEFLAAGNTMEDTNANEHENVLDLEMMARDTVRAIAEAI